MWCWNSVKLNNVDAASLYMRLKTLMWSRRERRKELPCPLPPRQTNPAGHNRGQRSEWLRRSSGRCCNLWTWLWCCSSLPEHPLWLSDVTIIPPMLSITYLTRPFPLRCLHTSCLCKMWINTQWRCSDRKINDIRLLPNKRFDLPASNSEGGGRHLTN